MAAFDVAVAFHPAAAEHATIGTGRVLLDANADGEAFAWLCDLDPVFLLCIPGGRDVTVVLELASDQQNFTISYYEGPPEREIAATFTTPP
ncbi:hypothetical protein [Dactylosporangium matsuzakiense]|uniref:hypothetical protein n=1 Tax=Dactylosporangium matsuzakiense TaxID=53360 RepID=UPI0021C4C0E8|nr:hypothetical protein [Dactylosporangium matsuzakiense]UWZ48366.1 hypothetical protein Dmats_19325 [Dactylosporangium matsuzakiense]